MVKQVVKSDDNKMEEFVCWPRDWLPGEFSWNFQIVRKLNGISQKFSRKVELSRWHMTAGLLNGVVTPFHYNSRYVDISYFVDK
jgi:hypothetical protein